jgi:L-malate glycosyltransferase
LKVLILINSLSYGGAERQVLQDANLLTRAGHKVTVCYGADRTLSEHFDNEVVLLELKTTTQTIASAKLLKHLMTNKYDIILSHMFWANKVAALAGKLTGHHVIAFEHGLGLWRKWYHLMLVKMVGKYASAVVTCSEANRKNKIQREGVPADKVFVLPNSFQRVNGLSGTAHIEKSHNTFVIGYAGRFNKVKQLHLLVEIALLLKEYTSDFKFMLIGDGSERENLDRLIDENNMGEYFLFPGYVPDPYPYYMQMDCFILPSAREDLSLALIEASYAGMPCLAFDVGGNNEIIIDGKTGWLIEPYDIRIMVNRIAYMQKNIDSTKLMGYNAREWISRKFSGENRVERLSGLIERYRKI